MEEEIKNAGYHPADTNGDGKVTKREQEMYLEFKRKELEDADAMRDAQRQMAWYSLYGMLLYPVLVIGSNVVGYEKAADILGDMAGVYLLLLLVLLLHSLVHKQWVKNKGIKNGRHHEQRIKSITGDH